MISWPRRVIELARRASKKRHAGLPSTPYSEFIWILIARERAASPRRFASSRAFHIASTIPGKIWPSRAKLAPSNPGIGSSPGTARPSGSMANVRMMLGYRLLKSNTSTSSYRPGTDSITRPPGLGAPVWGGSWAT